MPTAAIQDIITAAESNGVRVGVYAMLPGGETVAHREDESFIVASTIKIAIMVRLYQMVDAGEIKLTDMYALREEDICPGSGVMQGLHIGTELTLGDICYLMMSISDNTATNVLIDVVGMEQVNASIRDLGLNSMILARKMRGGPAIEGEGENLGTPAEFAKLIESILDGRAASAESCMAMLDTLKTQANERRIGRYVPAGWEWGSKTGSHTTTVNDVGFVMTNDGPLIISVFIQHAEDVVAGEIIISDISRELIQGVTAN